MFSQAIKPLNGAEVLGPYSPAIKLGDFVYVSGQLPMDETGAITGTTIEEQTAQAIANIENVLAAMNLELRHVVKTTVFMSDLGEFEAFNKVYGEKFAQPYPARSCVQVAALPKGAKVEIECLVIDTLVYERQMAASQCGGGCSGGCSGDCGSDCECGQ